jgi:ribosomal protein S18 acetylase RimI-like enzyme
MIGLHPPFRRATPEDARALAELIDCAGRGIPALLWAEEAEAGETPLDVGARLAARSGYALCYENAVVGEHDGRVTCLLLGCLEGHDDINLSDAPDIAQPIIRLKRHAPETWHVHALAVAPDHRGQGLGTRLLRIVDALAADEGVLETSLTVAESNEGAVRLYDREGYRVLASEPMARDPRVNLSGNWLLMTRPVVPQG